MQTNESGITDKIGCVGKDFLNTCSSQFGDVSYLESSTNGSPMKKFRRTRDERKKLTDIGKNEL